MINLNVKQEVWQKAKAITHTFEGGQACGNFDGQYLSMGVLQWNLGQGTLQPILKEVFETYGAKSWGLQDLYQAILDDSKDFYAQINNYGTRLIEPWQTRLNELNNSEEFQDISDKYCTYYKNKAIEICESFGITTDRAFCLAFDIAVQCGGLERYEMVETEYFDRLTSMAEVTAIKCGKWADDVRKRKMAIVRGCDQGRGWAGVEFDDMSMYESEVVIVIETLDQAIEVLVSKGKIDPNYPWKTVCNAVKFLDAIFIKWANDCK